MPRPTLRDVHPNLGALQNISIAYRNENYIYREVFPIVQVAKQSDFYFIFSKQSWLQNRSGPRAPGTRAPRAGYALTTGSYLCVNDSLATTVPIEVINNADSPLRPLISAVSFISDGLDLAEEVRVANVVGASTNWANSASAGTLWSSDTSDPWGDIDTATNTVIQAIGRQPNVAVMSWDVWRHLRQHPDFLDRVKYTRSSGRVEAEDLRSWFGFDKVLIGTAVIDSALEGQTSSQSYVWGDGFWTGFVPNAPALETPAAGYVLVWGQGNRAVEQYFEVPEKQYVVESGWSTSEKVTASDSGFLMMNVV